MTIILIRHGETNLNRAKILQPPDTPLSELGEQQAARLARSLKGRGVDTIFSSDMKRAAQTADAIALALQLPVQYSTLLHERNFGDLRGKRYSELSIDPMDGNYLPPNGESWAQFRQRVASAFESILQLATGSGKTLAVVSHGLVIKEIVARHLQLDQPIPEHFENTSITVFERHPPYKISQLADASHIADLMEASNRTGKQGGLV